MNENRTIHPVSDSAMTASFAPEQHVSWCMDAKDVCGDKDLLPSRDRGGRPSRGKKRSDLVHNLNVQIHITFFIILGVSVA